MLLIKHQSYYFCIKKVQKIADSAFFFCSFCHFLHFFSAILKQIATFVNPKEDKIQKH